MLFAATLGYSFSKFQYWGRDLFLGFVLLIITLPYVIYLIPIYIMQSRFDLIDTRLGLILPYIATNLPMSVFIMRGQSVSYTHLASSISLIGLVRAFVI